MVTTAGICRPRPVREGTSAFRLRCARRAGYGPDRNRPASQCPDRVASPARHRLICHFYCVSSRTARKQERISTWWWARCQRASPHPADHAKRAQGTISDRSCARADSSTARESVPDAHGWSSTTPDTHLAHCDGAPSRLADSPRLHARDHEFSRDRPQRGLPLEISESRAAFLNYRTMIHNNNLNHSGRVLS